MSSDFGRQKLTSAHGGLDRGETPGTAARSIYDRRSSSGKLTQPWLIKQEKVFSAWCNAKLASGWASRKAAGETAPAEPVQIDDLITDFSDGIKLYQLLETLSGENLRVLGKLSLKPRMDIQKIANLNICFKYLRQTVKMVGIGEKDILDSDAKLVLGMVWSIIVWFMLKELGTTGGGLAKVKEAAKSWAAGHVNNPAKYPGVAVANFTTSFADGRAFLAILNSHSPEICPYDPTDDARDNLDKAFGRAHDGLGVPRLLDASDMLDEPDEKAVLCYINCMQGAIPAVPAAGGGGGGAAAAADADAKAAAAAAAAAKAAADAEAARLSAEADKARRAAEAAAFTAAAAKRDSDERAALEAAATDAAAQKKRDEQDAAAAKTKAMAAAAAKADADRLAAKAERDAKAEALRALLAAKAERDAKAEALRVKTRAEVARYADVDHQLYELTSRMLELSLQKGAHKATIQANAAEVQRLVDEGDDLDGKGESIFAGGAGVDPFQGEVRAALTAVPPADVSDDTAGHTKVLLVGYAHEEATTAASTAPGDIDLATSKELFRRVVAVAKTAPGAR